MTRRGRDSPSERVQDATGYTVDVRRSDLGGGELEIDEAPVVAEVTDDESTLNEGVGAVTVVLVQTAASSPGNDVVNAVDIRCVGDMLEIVIVARQEKVYVVALQDWIDLKQIVRKP